MTYINSKIASEVFYEGTYRNIRIHVDAIKYVTPKKTAQVIMNLIDAKHIGPGTLLNMTGNYGGDTVPFLVHGWTGTVCEIDPEVSADLSYNLDQYDNKGAIDVHTGDAIEYVRTRRDVTYDLVFIDPPFGEQYRTYVDSSDSDDDTPSVSFVDPTLGGVSMADIVKLLRGITKNVIIKLPKVGDAVKNMIKMLGHNGYSFDVYSPARMKAIDPLHRNHKVTIVFVTIR